MIRAFLAIAGLLALTFVIGCSSESGTTGGGDTSAVPDNADLHGGDGVDIATPD